jgi:magnesium-transporting ATPase (P-type)
VAAQFLFLRELDAGRSPETARTLAVNTLVAGQVFYLFNARYIHARSFLPRRLVANPAALVAGGVLLVLQASFTYLPVLQLWFGTEGMRLTDWLWASGAGLLVFAAVEVEKAVVRRWNRERKPGPAERARRGIRE